MSLTGEWRSVFAGGDLVRGEDCYYEGMVHGLKQGPEGWTARVFGSETYTTFVPANPDDLYGMTCDCPRFADGHFCKHLAATCLAIEGGHLADQGAAPATSAQDVRDLVDEVTEDDLRSFVKEVLAREEMWATLFAQRYGVVDARASCQNMASQIESATWDYADRGFIDWRGALGFERQYHEIVHTSIDPLVARGDLVAALELSIQALRSLQRIEIDDSDGFFSSAIDDVEGMWGHWLGTSDDFDALLFDRISEFLRTEPRDDQEREIYSYAADMARSFQLEHYLEHPAYAERFVVLADSKLGPAQESLADATLGLERARSAREAAASPRGRASTKVLAHIQQLEREERSLEFKERSLDQEVTRWVIIRLKALRASGMGEDELRREAGDHIVREQVCQLFVDMALRRDDTDTALGLLLDCKEHQRAGGGAYSPKVAEQLADLQAGRDVAAMCEELAYLIDSPFYTNQGPSVRDLWVRLRESYDEQEWPTQRERALARVENARSRRDCLAAEGLYDRLMNEAEKEGIYGISAYERELVEHCPERVLKLYLDNLERDRSYPGSTRKGYRQFAQHLLHVKALPGGEGPVAAIVARTLDQYPNRPALRDELSVV